MQGQTNLIKLPRLICLHLSLYSSKRREKTITDLVFMSLWIGIFCLHGLKAVLLAIHEHVGPILFYSSRAIRNVRCFLDFISFSSSVWAGQSKLLTNTIHFSNVFVGVFTT